MESESPESVLKKRPMLCRVVKVHLIGSFGILDLFGHSDTML